MHTGMLWFDNSSDSLAAKIEKAAEYYLKKYGRKADLCLVHPNMMEPVALDGMVVRPYRPVLPGHIWVGVEEMPVSPAETS